MFIGKWLDHVGQVGKRHFCIVVETKKKGVPHEYDLFRYSYGYFYFENYENKWMKEIEEREHVYYIAEVVNW